MWSDAHQLFDPFNLIRFNAYPALAVWPALKVMDCDQLPANPEEIPIRPPQPVIKGRRLDAQEPGSFANGQEPAVGCWRRRSLSARTS